MLARFAMAPKILGKIGNFLNPGQMSTIDKVMRFGPDIGFGALAAAQTPGDLGDKAIAFGAAAGGGLLGGLGSAGAVRHFGKKMDPQALQAAMGAADMFGSIGVSPAYFFNPLTCVTGTLFSPFFVNIKT